MNHLFWVALVLSVILWFAADWVGGLFIQDELALFVFTFAVATTGGGLLMLMFRLRALRSGRYEKARWGVRKR
ncbi:MAG: hypothetical protein AABX89_04830 [Candidatus Thermoplasmatota archaeon]